MKSKIAKTLLIILILAIIVAPKTILAENEMPEKPEKLSIITTGQWEEMASPGAEMFEEKYGIEVEWQSVPFDEVWTEITSTIMGGVPLDIIWLSEGSALEISELNMAYPIDDFVEEDLLDNYLDISLDIFRANDELWALPAFASAPYFYYNAEMLSDLGYDSPPETWQEVEEISREAMDQGLADHGLFLGLAPVEGLMVYYDAFLKLFDGDWMNEERTEWTFNSEEGIEALEYLKGLIDDGIVPRESLETADRDSHYSFIRGNAPFHFNWGFVHEIILDPEESDIADVAEATTVPGIVKDTYTVMGGGGWGVSATTRSKEWSMELIKYLANKESAMEFFQLRYAEAPWEELYSDEYMEEFPTEESLISDIYFEQVQQAGFRPGQYLNWYSDFRDNIFLPYIHDALMGNMPVEDALNNAQREAQQRLEQEGL